MGPIGFSGLVTTSPFFFLTFKEGEVAWQLRNILTYSTLPINIIKTWQYGTVTKHKTQLSYYHCQSVKIYNMLHIYGRNFSLRIKSHLQHFWCDEFHDHLVCVTTNETCSWELWEKVCAPSHQKPEWVFVLTWSSLCTWTDPPLNWLSLVTVQWLTLFVNLHFVYPYFVIFLSLSFTFHIRLAFCIGKTHMQ